MSQAFVETVLLSANGQLNAKNAALLSLRQIVLLILEGHVQAPMSHINLAPLNHVSIKKSLNVSSWGYSSLGGKPLGGRNVK